MRRAAVAVTFAEIYDAPTEGEWDGRDGDISDLVRYHEVPAGSHKLFEDKGRSTHFIACFLTVHCRCSRQPTLFNQWIKSNRHTVGRTYYEMWLKTLNGLNAGNNFADALRETALSLCRWMHH